MRRRNSSSSSGFGGQLAWLLLVCSWRIAAAQAEREPKTDPIEVSALNMIMGRWGVKASSEWNISGEPCSGVASDKSNWDNYPKNPAIKCDCSYNNNTICHIIKLRVYELNVVGQIPAELQNLTYLEDLGLGFNPLSGPLPKELGNLTYLLSLGISLDNFTGELPEELGNLTKLEQLRIGDIVNGSSSLAFISNLTSLNNLVLRNCRISGNLDAVDFSKLATLTLLDMSFNNITGQVPQSIVNLGMLKFLTIYNQFAFPDTQTWLSLGRRVFDIYVQGALKEKNFDIRKTAGGKSFTTINRTYTATVLKNFLEIHLFWAGKGTSAIPTQGYYGPMVSALSVTPNFTPTVRNGVPKKGSKAGAIAGILTGVSVLGLAGFGMFMWIKKRRAMAQQKEGDSSLNLDWAMRFEIILGIARGLSYLHEESSVCIVHRDIKASNILLDTDLTPKISDFGLAKLYDEKQTHVSTRIAGTFGYLAPEYAMRGHLTQKADVFAFGVVVLEIVAGRSNTNNSLEESKINLLEWAWDQYEKEQALRILDPSLRGFNKDEAFRVICVALHCTQGSPHQRPPMSKVVAMLTGEVEVAELVTKPSYITEWQMMDGNRSYVTSSYSGSTTHQF
ncbi:hypothetical protein E2562_014561 [Oryza meyeriana var. granulata]|uniref:non-specific serine/threonine protein kinase n=1 Tax=Oryza meyeriana var. granulata TaxID=110450 RepID=A0A6G1EK26_9ORYZ|nr:hypothetical protein E2562_014561 [Oryza meyeriana var. granulata]